MATPEEQELERTISKVVTVADNYLQSCLWFGAGAATSIFFACIALARGELLKMLIMIVAALALGAWSRIIWKKRVGARTTMRQLQARRVS